ncbi:MAG: hypothetical protein DRN29_05205 [Thermoplasmata archaeon]|nr:MAG: hypothetical protein DRN29_05205 [Thermoplasmata archaeon]
MLPNFLICGASKSGTTTLQEVLCTHPDIFMPKKKRANGREIHFFNNDKNFAKGIEWYEKQFEGWNGEKAIGEKTPSYLCTPCVPERIHKFLPDVKLIFILRHPVDRAYSEYWMKRRNGIEDREFEDAYMDYVDEGKYSVHLMRYKKYFSDDQMLIIILKELKERPLDVYRRIFRFLGVDENFIPPNFDKKHYKGGVARSRMLSKLHKFIRYELELPTLAEAINLINIKGQMVEFLFGKEAKSYPPMNPDIRRKLIEFYKPYNEELKSMYPHLDIRHWGE